MSIPQNREEQLACDNSSLQGHNIELRARVAELESELAWALDQVPNRQDGGIASKWRCPHCQGVGTSNRQDEPNHKPSCPLVIAYKVLKGNHAPATHTPDGKEMA